MNKQSIKPLSKPFLNECLNEMSQLQRILLPLLAESCPTDGCIRCLGIETCHTDASDEMSLCEQARFLQQYMACAIASIYRLDTATQQQQGKNIKIEFEALNTLLKIIKMQLLELQPSAKTHNDQFSDHVAAMLALLQDIQTEENVDTLKLIEMYFQK